MGKYMRKAEITGSVAVMEVVSQSSLGVRTRAKTLALQRLQSTTTPPPPPPPPRTTTTTTNPESSYLQLRSRRLEKVPPLINDTKKQRQRQQQPTAKGGCGKSPNPNHSANPSSGMRSRFSISCSKNEEGVILEFTAWASKEDETEDYNDLDTEPSFGENNLDFDGRESSTRESTPCSFIRESDAAGTPASTIRQTGSTPTNQRNIPTTHEMEEFFACAEQEQQRLFTEKYNFDVVNDLPLPGHYEWVRVNQ